MQISVNDKPIQLPESPCTVVQLLAHLQMDSRGIALAINQRVIPKSKWPSHLLEENDQVIIIRATQGG